MKHAKVALICAIIIFATSLAANAQKHTVSGYIYDQDSGEPLIGVAVIDLESSSGCVTGNYGFYSITLPEGDHTLIISCLGYEEQRQSVKLYSNIKLDLRIKIASDLLSESVVTSARNETGVLGTQMSAIEVPISQIKAVPAFLGEVDVIKALQLLPGVQSGTEGSAGFYVRGGGADENLMLMDGVPLYNANHLMGFFSVFNADAIKNVTLYKGSFPARFGSRLSSVIDVRLNDGNEQEIHGNVSIGAISSKFNLEGPIVKGRTTFNISARRTYMDLLTKPLFMLANKDSYKDEYNYSKGSGGYNFYDINAKITHKFRNNDKISLSIYSGDDTAEGGTKDVSTQEIYTWNEAGNQKVPSGYLQKSTSNTSMQWKWGNFVSSLRYNHSISPTIYMSACASYTQYRSHLGIDINEQYQTLNSNMVQQSQEKEEVGMGYNSLVNDISAAVDFDWHPSVSHDVKFGSNYTYHMFKPAIISCHEKMSNSEEAFEYPEFNFTAGDKELYANEASLYIEDNWTVTPWLKANIGLHSSIYNVDGKTYFSAEPRISARAMLSKDISVKASYSEMSQYIHLLCNSALSMPSDIWVPVTKNIDPMRSRQSALGIFYNLMDKYEFSIEGYYKTMDNVLEYKDGASYLGTSTGWEEKVCMGRGWAYGIEFFVQKKVGKTTGWIGYTLAKAMRQFDREDMMINDGVPFPAKYDRRHDLSATISHSFSKKFDISATFVFESGNCGTLAFEDIYIKDYTQGYGYSSYGHSTGYVTHRNNYRMPPYNRMDVGMNYHKQKKHGVATWNISVYNVYNRLNPFMVMPGTHTEHDDATDTWISYPVLKQISIMPIIPTVSYTYKF